VCVSLSVCVCVCVCVCNNSLLYEVRFCRLTLYILGPAIKLCSLLLENGTWNQDLWASCNSMLLHCHCIVIELSLNTVLVWHSKEIYVFILTCISYKIFLYVTINILVLVNISLY
jgi:hypothetical protein